MHLSALKKLFLRDMHFNVLIMINTDCGAAAQSTSNMWVDKYMSVTYFTY